MREPVQIAVCRAIDELPQRAQDRQHHERHQKHAAAARQPAVAAAGEHLAPRQRAILEGGEPSELSRRSVVGPTLPPGRLPQPAGGEQQQHRGERQVDRGHQPQRGPAHVCGLRSRSITRPHHAERIDGVMSLRQSRAAAVASTLPRSAR